MHTALAETFQALEEESAALFAEIAGSWGLLLLQLLSVLGLLTLEHLGVLLATFRLFYCGKEAWGSGDEFH